MKKTKLRGLLSILMVFVFLCGCAPVQPGGAGAPSTGPETESKKRIRHNMGTDPATLDPALNGTLDAGLVLNHVFEGLTRMVDSKPVPAAAKSWEVSPDGLTYTFTLRDDATWADGKPVTAKDFVYSWKRVLDPKTAAEFAYQLYYLKGAKEYNDGKGSADDVALKAIDDKTLQAQLVSPTPYFLELCGFFTLMPVRQDIVEKDPEKWAAEPATYIGNGPFKLDKWTHNDRLVLVKNDAYHSAKEVKIEEIDFVMINEASTALAAFENEEIDVTDTLPNEKIASLKEKNPHFKIFPDSGTYFYVFNVSKPPFDNAQVRKAFTAAIDRQAIVQTVVNGGQVIASGIVPPNLMVNGNQDFRELAGDYGIAKTADREKARDFLAQGGYPEGQGFPAIDMLYNTSENNKSIAEAMQNMFKENLSLDIPLRNEEWKVFQETRRSGDYTIARHTWIGDYSDPMTFLDMWTSNSGHNDAQWKNPAYDQLIEKAKQEPDPAKRTALLLQAEKMLMDEMIILPLYYYTVPTLVRDTIVNYKPSPLAQINYRDADIRQK